MTGKYIINCVINHLTKTTKNFAYADSSEPMSTDDLFACGLTLLQQAKVCDTFVLESIRERLFSLFRRVLLGVLRGVLLGVLLEVRDVRNVRGDAPEVRGEVRDVRGERNESLTVVVTLTVIVTSTVVGTSVYIGHNFSTSNPGGIPTYPSPP